jgi:hypothetical protein
LTDHPIQHGFNSSLKQSIFCRQPVTPP